jgi:ABC-type transport system substrate-binding protein
MDIAERTGKYEEIQKILIDDVVEIPLWNTITYIGVRTWVKGLKLDTSFNLYLNDVTVVEE